MFAYETVADCRLILLGAIPKRGSLRASPRAAWGFPRQCDLIYEAGALRVRFSAPLQQEAELVWRNRLALLPC